MKKGFALVNTLIAVLILILGAFILYTFAGNLRGVLKEDAEIETCKLSVLVQAQTKVTGKSVVPLDCPRRNLKIFEDKVEINGERSKKYSFKELTSEDLNYIIAEELRLCWYKMAEGNKNIFEQSTFFGQDQTCLVCAEIGFDDKIMGKSYGGLVEYLKSHKMPKSGLNYFEYLIKAQEKNVPSLLYGDIPWTQYTPWGYGTTKKFSEDRINGNEKYSIYFLAFKPAWVEEKIRAYTSAYYIGLGKDDKIREECSILVN